MLTQWFRSSLEYIAASASPKIEAISRTCVRTDTTSTKLTVTMQYALSARVIDSGRTHCTIDSVSDFAIEWTPVDPAEVLALALARKAYGLA